MANFSGFQEQGFDLTDLEVKRLEREIKQVYDKAYKSITSDLKGVYAKLAGIDSSDAGYYNELLKRDRYKALLADVSTTYNKYLTKSNGLTASASKVAINNNYYRQQFASQWGALVNFGALPEEVINLSVFGTQEAWNNYTKQIATTFGPASAYQPKEGTLSYFLTNHKRDELQKIRQTITQGLIEGKSYTKMASSIKDVTGREIIKDGKKTLTGGKANAMRIVRTEAGRTMNAGAYAQANYLQSEDIGVQKRWLATLDLRTRARHASLDGKTIEVDGSFTIGGDVALYPGDFGQVGNNVNCRCTTIDIIEGFPPEERRGRNPVTGKNEVFSWKDYDQWAKDNNLVKSSSGRLIPRKAPKVQKIVEGRFKANKAIEAIAKSKGVTVQDVVNVANEYSNKYPRRKVNIGTIEGLI